jgi:NADPH-dependent glutamate synthase beta subunit-like oxidoreductase
VALLREKGFEAIFLAVGAQLSRRIELEGSALDGVHWGVEFLSQVAEGRPPAVREEVAVIGGGNVAVDVALTALRLGAKKVTLACLEKREEMPANPWEIEQAQAEGVEMLYAWGPSRILGSEGQVTGLELVRCTSVFDSQGNFCPYFDETKTTIDADQVFLAVGQASETAFCRDFCFLEDQGDLPVQKGLIAIDPETQQTKMRGVFAGGDAANGPATVIQAIAAGRRAAAAIDRFLGGDGLIEVGRGKGEGGKEKPAGGSVNGYDGSRAKGFAELPRCEIPFLPISERRTSFDEVERGCDESQMAAEVRRCLQCDLEICLAGNKRRTATGA